MKRLLLAVALLTAFPCATMAQVEKQVEVTKAYVPKVEQAAKLAIEPDMTDTVQMRPEIDYTITPLSLETTLDTRPIRPASVTYWEFNRPLPFYLKVGAGYPLNSVLDFYAATQNPDTGYALGYINHKGRYADIRNCFDVKNNSLWMENRAGVAAGKYLGRHLLEGHVSYENRLLHRYGVYLAPWHEDMRPWMEKPVAGSKVNYGEFALKVRFGDDFKDMERLNFDVTLDGLLFRDHSWAYDYPSKAQQTNLGAKARLGRRFGRHLLLLQGGYDYLGGGRSYDSYSENIVRAGARYGYEGGVVALEVGADYTWDKIAGASSRSYIFPYARFEFNIGTEKLRPFLDVDGGLHDNSFRSLTRMNPYVTAPTRFNAHWEKLNVSEPPQLAFRQKSSADYNVRLGIHGSIFRKMLSYRIYAGFSVRDDHPYWYSLSAREFERLSDEGGDESILAAFNGYFIPVFGRQTVTSFHGEVEFRPVSSFLLSLEVHGYAYNNDLALQTGEPRFRGAVKARYEGGKVSFGVGLHMQGKRKWSTLYEAMLTPQLGSPEYIYAHYFSPDYLDSFEAPFAFDLRADVVWKVSGRVTLFAEGRNLLDRRLYDYARYPEYGANFTAGVILNF